MAENVCLSENKQQMTVSTVFSFDSKGTCNMTNIPTACIYLSPTV